MHEERVSETCPQNADRAQKPLHTEINQDVLNFANHNPDVMEIFTSVYETGLYGFCSTHRTCYGKTNLGRARTTCLYSMRDIQEFTQSPVEKISVHVQEGIAIFHPNNFANTTLVFAV